MHTAQQLRECADHLERANVHNDMGLSLTLTQAADLLRWAADTIDQQQLDLERKLISD
jgi:hypothetical protein